jgi:hypothetical protein
MGIGNVSGVKNAWTCFKIRGMVVCRLLILWPYATQIAYIFRFGSGPLKSIFDAQNSFSYVT